MALGYPYLYIKKEPISLVRVFRNNTASVFSSLLMFTGAAILSWVAWPIISFKLLVAPQFRQILAPIPESRVRQVFAQSAVPVIDDTSVDYTKASSWFPQLPQEETTEVGNEYRLSVSKLGIEKAKVIIGGEDISKNLIHYGGTALPGDYGNAVVFGHSTLPYFYDPTNYTTIFSKLPSLNKGDEINIDYDGLRYNYVIEEMLIVKPKDIQILEQRFDDSYLTLVTCVPPGTYLERLVVRARLKKYE